MPRDIVLRPSGKLTAAWLDRVRIEGGTVYEGRQVVDEDVACVTVKDTDVRGLELRMSASRRQVMGRFQAFERNSASVHHSRWRPVDVSRGAPGGYQASGRSAGRSGPDR